MFSSEHRTLLEACTYLAVLDPSQAPNEIRHVDEQSSKLFHQIIIPFHDFFNGIDASLQCGASSAHHDGREARIPHPTSSSGLPIHSRRRRLPIRVLQLDISPSEHARPSLIKDFLVSLVPKRPMTHAKADCHKLLRPSDCGRSPLISAKSASGSAKVRGAQIDKSIAR